MSKLFPQEVLAAVGDTFSQSLAVGAVASIYWPAKALSAAYAIGRHPSFNTLLQRNGGYFSSTGLLSNNPPQWRNVFMQMGGNAVLHLTAEKFTNNLFLISTIAASGAFPGTFMMTHKEAGNHESFFKLLRQSTRHPRGLHFLGLGFLCEILRELCYNQGCLNASKKLTELGLTGIQLIAATGLVSAGIGSVSGVPNAFASRFYLAAFDPSILVTPTKSQLRSLGMSFLMRGLGIGAVFTTLQAAQSFGSFFRESPPREPPDKPWAFEQAHSNEP